MPLPRELLTPPVTKMNFAIGRVLCTGGKYTDVPTFEELYRLSI